MGPCVLVFLFSVAFVVADDQYTSKFDNVDYEGILKNDRLFGNYAKCLLDQGTCPPDGLELKKILPDALQTDCSKCNDKQKEASRKVISFLVKNKPDTWKDLTKKYDPDGTYKSKFCKIAQDEGVASDYSC